MKFQAQNLMYQLKYEYGQAKMKKDWYRADQIKNRIKKLKRWSKEKKRLNNN